MSMVWWRLLSRWWKKGFLFSSGRDRIENNREAGKTGGGKDTYPGKRGVTI